MELNGHGLMYAIILPPYRDRDDYVTPKPVLSFLKWLPIHIRLYLLLLRSAKGASCSSYSIRNFVDTQYLVFDFGGSKYRTPASIRVYYHIINQCHSFSKYLKNKYVSTYLFISWRRIASRLIYLIPKGHSQSICSSVHVLTYTKTYASRSYILHPIIGQM